MIREADLSVRGFASRVSPHAFEEVTEITVLAADHPRLLSVIAGACFVAGANIVDAQIDTTTDGFALDTIFISRELPGDADELRRGERICKLIERALRGEERLPESVASKAASRTRVKAFRVESEVLVNNALSNRHTVLEITGLDRPGLLYDLTRAISDLNLNINSAHVATFGERVVDVFYVTDLTGQKIANIGRQEAIRDRLRAAVDGDAGEDQNRRKSRRAGAA
jgi:[protein-PII] uridylyltransferase